jgi:AraC family transcriptional regulator
MAYRYVPGDLYFPVDRAKIFERPTALSSRALGWRGIMVERYNSMPDSYTSPGLISHLVTVHEGVEAIGTHRHSGRNVTERLTDGMAHVFPAGLYRSVDLRTRSTDIFVGIDPEHLRHSAEALDINPHHMDVPMRMELNDPLLTQLARGLVREAELGARGGAMVAEALGNAMVMHLLRTYVQHSPIAHTHYGKLNARRLKRAVDYIHAHLAEALSVRDIAASVHLSAFHFTRMFRESMGLAPHQYVLNVRVETAKRLLSEGSPDTVAQIGLRVGFADQSHFSRAFKRATGVSPALFRHTRPSLVH